MIEYYRAKEYNTGKWVYGFYGVINICGIKTDVIYDCKDGCTCYEIDKNTLCECLSCYDSKKNQIFIGDVLKTLKGKALVYSDKSRLQYRLSFDTLNVITCGFSEIDLEHSEVIGNIFDDSSLFYTSSSNQVSHYLFNQFSTTIRSIAKEFNSLKGKFPLPDQTSN